MAKAETMFIHWHAYGRALIKLSLQYLTQQNKKYMKQFI